MGRATVISGGTDGRYVIEMDYGLAQRNARVAKLDTTLAVLDVRKTWQQDEVDKFQGGLATFQGQVNPLIDAYRAALLLVPPVAGQAEGIRKQLDTLTQDIVKQQLWLAQAKAALAHTDLEIQQLTLDRAALMALEITEQRPAWCADLTEEASGAVSTIDVPGESSLILIYPGALAPDASDGVLTAREIQSPAQCFWNAAVLPGWQKFKPTYRWGTITALDTTADTASVALAAAVSSAQGLDVNQATALTGVPVQYMECNASAFAVGDNVIIEFAGQDWAQPIVIGFLDTPRACGGGMIGVPSSDDWHTGYNTPGWVAPRPGPSGIWNNHARTAMPDNLAAGLAIAAHPGHITWSSRAFMAGTREVQVSWRGADSRYSEATGWFETGGGTTVPYERDHGYVDGDVEPWYIGSVYDLYSSTSSVWIDGKRLYTGIRKVIAAALHRPDPGNYPYHVILRVCTDNYPQPSNTRGVAVYDLSVPSTRPGGCTLDDLLASVTSDGAPMTIDATYPATDFRITTPAAGQWRHKQHPHFDALGERLATTIEELDSRGVVGVVGAAFSLPSWSIVQRVSLPSSLTFGSTTEYTGTTDIDGDYETVTITYDATTARATTYIIAVDWLRPSGAVAPDELVYVTLLATVSDVDNGVNAASSSAAYTNTGSSATTETFTVSHSRHGTIKTATRASARDTSGSVSGASGTAYTTVAAFEAFKVAFTGDLSRDVFAIGFADGQHNAAYTVGGALVNFNGITGLASTAAYTVPINNHRVKYDLYFGGTKIADQYLSGYSESYPTTGSTLTDRGSVEDAAARLVANGWLPDDESESVVWTSQHGASIWGTSISCPREKFGHMAVSPARTVAYFGVNHSHGSTNLVLRNGQAGLDDVQVAPAHAPGDNPTLAAPIFMGSAKYYPG